MLCLLFLSLGDCYKQNIAWEKLHCLNKVGKYITG